MRLNLNVGGMTVKQLKDKALIKKLEQKYKHFKKMRAEIIEEALYIENLLTVTILHFLVGTDYSRHGLLRALIFESEFCTFMNKRKMLSNIFQMYSDKITCISAKESKLLRSQLNHLILERDMVVHGDIFIKGLTGKVLIEYYRGEPLEQEIDDNFLKSFKKRCKLVDRLLSKTNEYFRRNRVDYPEKKSSIIPFSMKRKKVESVVK